MKKLIINEQDVAVRTSKKVEYTPSKLHENKRRASRSHQRHHQTVQRDYFWPRYPVCMGCLDGLRKQQVINEKIYDQKLMDDTVRKLTWDGPQKNIVMDCDTMIDRRTGEVLGPEVDSTYWKDQF